MFRWLGFSLIILGLLLLGYIFLPVAKEEVKYSVRRAVPQTVATEEIVPVSKDFGLVIPKIQANAPVIADVDPYDPFTYQRQLTKGVAHAKGSALPGQSGNIFLFAHSAGDWLEASRYNAVFYLLSKLTAGDEIDLWYYGHKFVYRVSEIKRVPASAVEYLDPHYSAKTLTLMTCWPPGTTIRRLLVTATLSGN